MTRSSVFQKIAPPYLLYFLAIFMTFRPLPTTTVWKWIPGRRCKQHFNLNLIFTRLKKKKKKFHQKILTSQQGWTNALKI